MFSMWKTLETQSPPLSPVPPKLDPKGYFDIERHTFSMWKTLEASPPQSPVPPKLDPKGYFDIERHMFSMWKTLETPIPSLNPSPHPSAQSPQLRP